jgi:hypothetical protein
MNSGRVLRVVDGITAVGWRAWTVQETRAGVRLGSVIHDAVWEPGRLAPARCTHSHLAPSAECTCGFHAARDPVDVFSYLRGRDELRTICRVLGEVLLLGTLVETDTGWRAARAYPLRLYVDDDEVAEALAAYAVPILSASCGSRSSRTCMGTQSPFVRRWMISRATSLT